MNTRLSRCGAAFAWLLWQGGYSAIDVRSTQ